MFAGVVSEKPPEISASREFQKLQHSGRVYKACSRVWFPKSRREFPRARDCRGSRTPVGCTRLVRGCSFRKAARNFRKPGIAAAPGPRPGVQSLFAGVVSKKPPEFPRARNCRGSRTPAGTLKEFRVRHARRASKYFRGHYLPWYDYFATIPQENGRPIIFREAGDAKPEIQNS